MGGGIADLACFGVAYIANANLHELYRTGKPLNLGGFDAKVNESHGQPQGACSLSEHGTMGHWASLPLASA